VAVPIGGVSLSRWPASRLVTHEVVVGARRSRPRRSVQVPIRRSGSGSSTGRRRPRRRPSIRRACWCWFTAARCRCCTDRRPRDRLAPIAVSRGAQYFRCDTDRSRRVLQEPRRPQYAPGSGRGMVSRRLRHRRSIHRQNTHPQISATALSTPCAIETDGRQRERFRHRRRERCRCLGIARIGGNSPNPAR
jgi:hypothetical protein